MAKELIGQKVFMMFTIVKKMDGTEPAETPRITLAEREDPKENGDYQIRLDRILHPDEMIEVVDKIKNNAPKIIAP